MKIIDGIKYDFSDVLLMPKRSDLTSRSQVTVHRVIKFKYSDHYFNGTPIIAANMDVVGTIEMAEAFKNYHMAVALHKFYQPGTLVEYFNRPDRNPWVFYTMGTSVADLEKFIIVMTQTLPERRPKFICIDIANGYSKILVSYVQQIREKYPDVCIMAGNVVTPDMVYDLHEKGADIVKVGIGSGAACLTRRVTGVGYPQLSAVIECSDASHGVGGQVCSDGGITCPGDVVKAFAGGSDFVMCGTMFAGHDECDGEILLDEEGRKTHMMFYGMSSDTAMKKYYGGKANYRASEGRTTKVPYKGPVSGTVEELLGGIRSACTYIGSRSLKDLPKCASFVQVNRVLNTTLEKGE